MCNNLNETMDSVVRTLSKQGCDEVSIVNNDEIAAIKYFKDDELHYIMAHKTLGFYSHSTYGVDTAYSHYVYDINSEDALLNYDLGDEYSTHTFYDYSDFIAHLYNESLLSHSVINTAHLNYEQGMRNLMKAIHSESV